MLPPNQSTFSRGKVRPYQVCPCSLKIYYVFTAPKGPPEALLGGFVGHDKNYKRIIYDQRHKENLVSDVQGMKSFLVHRNMPLRKAHETLNASDHLPNNYKVFMTKTINKSEEEQFIPKNIKHELVEDGVSDPCLHRTADFRTFLIEHVDDIMVLTQNKSQIEELLLKHFKHLCIT
jgi:hypothetical protein